MKTESKKAVIAALVANLGIAVLKFAAAMISRSSAMLAETYHSISDTLNQILLLYGLKKCRKAPSRLHPFGYGKEQFFWSFMVAVLLFGVAGTLSLREGYHKIMHPEPIHNVMLNYVVLAAAAVFESFAFRIAFHSIQSEKKRGGYRSYMEAVKKSKDPTMLTVLFEDFLALLGLAIAALGTFFTQITGLLLIDGIASILIGVLLMVFAFFLAAETKKLLVGESISANERKKILEILKEFEEIEGIISVKTMHLSADEVLIAMELDYQSDLRAGAIEKLNDRIEAKILEILPEARIYIEAETPPEETPAS